MSLLALPNELIAHILRLTEIDSKREYVKLRLVCRRFDDHASRVILQDSSLNELDIGRRLHWRLSIEWMLATKARVQTCKQGVFAFVHDAAEHVIGRGLIPQLTLDAAIVAACRLIVAVNEPSWVVNHLVTWKPGNPLPPSLASLENYTRGQKVQNPEIFYGTLHLLVACGDKAAVESIMRKLANIDAIDSVVTHPVFGDLMRAAIVLDQVAAIRTLLLHGLDPRTIDVEGQRNGTLVYAAEMNREAAARTILSLSTTINISARGRYSNTALGWAARRGWTATVQLLLQRDDINPNLGNRRLESPLAAAAKGDHGDIVRLLLDRRGVLPLSFGCWRFCPWRAAVKSGAARVARLFLDRFGDEININDSWSGGETALSLATSKGFTPLVRVLLDVPGIEPDKIHHGRWTPLALAVQGGHTETVRLLLHCRVNVGHRIYHDLLARRALENNHTAIFELLVERALETDFDNWRWWRELYDISQRYPRFEMTVLRTFLNIPRFRSEKRDVLQHIVWPSMIQGKVSVIEELLRHDEIDSNICTNGITTLAVAATSDRASEMISLLLSRQDFDVNIADGGGMALMIAVRKYDLDAVQLLVKVSELRVNYYNGGGRRDHKVKFRLRGGYNYQDYHLSKKSAFKGWLCAANFADTRTPLMIAAETGHETIFGMICEHPRTDHYVTDGLERTCLWWAAKCKNMGMVQNILACSPDVARIINVQDDEGWAPLHVAANYSSVPIAKLLLGRPEIDVNVATKQGWTALHMAMPELGESAA
ncbi:unnamed protein product [Clonostachys rosea f. rosea IK726]|uniref:Uncharacterized protein n=1 Tax=Clonostachys rosea f. rosea IK726 TaxID=1349383 RepID=A0ACA9UYM9_BIOOC|nr:unnamed protein product [Clonostachys rosea f. rosea IK726]